MDEQKGEEEGRRRLWNELGSGVLDGRVEGCVSGARGKVKKRAVRKEL